MPGLLGNSVGLTASNLTVTPTGDVSSTNIQDAIAELASEKATVQSVSAISSNDSSFIMAQRMFN
jgi:hypothetical protein